MTKQNAARQPPGRADISPVYEPRAYLETMRFASPDWPDLLAEFIDNSLEAGAGRVRLAFGKSRFEIGDDGGGCEDLLDMATPGRRRGGTPMPPSRFGRGCAEAMFRLGNRAAISSRRGGVGRRLDIDYAAAAKAGSWLVAPPTAGETAEPDGNVITIKNITEVRKMPADYAALGARLGALYHPALTLRKLGLSIEYPGGEAGGVVIHAQAAPAMSPAERCEGVLPDGRKFLAEAGIITAPSERRRNGVGVANGSRVLVENVRWGLGRNPTPGLRVYVILPGTRGRLAAEDEHAVGDMIAGRFAGLIAKATRTDFIRVG